MIERYTPKTMGALWSLSAKFRTWLVVSLAILEAKAKTGMISLEVYRQIRRHARVNTKRVLWWDEGPGGMHHDMQAFTETVKESLRRAGLDESVIGQFNNGITSYDIEDSALSLMLVRACQVLLPLIEGLRKALLIRASEHKSTLMMGLTHGQAAEPITLAVKMLNFVAMLDRDVERLIQAMEGVRVGRLAGAVGVYGHLGPDMEVAVCEALGLKSPAISTQILHRDCHAALMSALTTLGGNVGHIAHNFWRMVQFPRCEAREPFPKGKRGSSALPHKRNPNRLEQLRGMAEELVGYQTIMTLAIQTDDERAIDQSCQERINWPDAFALVAHMLTSLTKIVAGIEFFPEQMLANIAKIKGLHGSSYVKDLLLDKGITHLDFDGEEVQTYKWVQGCAFEAWQRQVELTDVLRERGIDNLVDPDELTVCFDPWRGLRHVPVIYERFGI